jgi:hypothetical protein
MKSAGKVFFTYFKLISSKFEPEGGSNVSIGWGQWLRHGNGHEKRPAEGESADWKIQPMLAYLFLTSWALETES